MSPKGGLLQPCACRDCAVPLFFLNTALINYHQRYLIPLPNLILRNAGTSLAILPPTHGRAGEEKDIVLQHAQAQIEQTELTPFSLIPANQ